MGNQPYTRSTSVDHTKNHRRMYNAILHNASHNTLILLLLSTNVGTVITNSFIHDCGNKNLRCYLPWFLL